MKDVEQRKILLIIILFYIISLPLPLCLFSEEKAPTVCLLKIHDISPRQTNLKYEAIILDILSVELENAGYSLINQTAASKDKFSLIHGPEAIALAETLGAQMAVTGFYYIEEQRITVDLKCYDVAQKKLIAGGLRSGNLGLSVYNLISNAIRGMLGSMKSRYYVKEAGFKEPLAIETANSAGEKLFIESLTLTSSQEGMQLVLPGQVLLGEIANGQLTTDLPFAIKSKILIEKQKKGYHSAREQIEVKKDGQETRLNPINKKNRFGLEFNLTNGQVLGLGAGFRYYPNPDYFFVSAENYFFVQHSLHPDDKPVFHDDFRVLAGHYLWDANALFRLAVSAGLGNIFTFFSVEGMQPKNDLYLNVGNIHCELNFSAWSIYLRQEFKYALGVGPNLLGRQWLFMNKGGVDLTLGVLGKW